MPEEQFVKRCLQSDGVTEDQARAFYAKLWQLHIDSKRGASFKGTSVNRKSNTLCKEASSTGYPSSRDPGHEDKENLPQFKERIRPGMAVRWTAHRYASMASSKHNLAVVLCPENAAGEHARDVLGKRINNGASQRYLCALVIPGTLAEAYEVNLWRQVVLDVNEMEAEVRLEYDPATRYYHISV